MARGASQFRYQDAAGLYLRQWVMPRYGRIACKSMGDGKKYGNQQVDSIHGRFDGKQDPSLLRSNQMLSIVRNRARLHAEFVVVETAFERFVTSDDLHTAASGDRIFHFHAPIGRVDHKPTQARAFQIDSAAHRAMEDPGYFALACLPRLDPRNWERLELFIR